MTSHLHSKWKVLEDAKKYFATYGENSAVIANRYVAPVKNSKQEFSFPHLLNKKFKVPVYPKYKGEQPVVNTYRITAADRRKVVENREKAL